MFNIHLLIKHPHQISAPPFTKTFTTYQTNTTHTINRIINLPYYHLLVEQGRMCLVGKKDGKVFREIEIGDVWDVEVSGRCVVVLSGDGVVVLDRYFNVVCRREWSDEDGIGRDEECDGVEKDGVEMDGVEMDGVEKDGVEKDGVEMDGAVRSDGVKNDRTRSRNVEGSRTRSVDLGNDGAKCSRTRVDEVRHCCAGDSRVENVVKRTDENKMKRNTGIGGYGTREDRGMGQCEHMKVKQGGVQCCSSTPHDETVSAPTKNPLSIGKKSASNRSTGQRPVASLHVCEQFIYVLKNGACTVYTHNLQKVKVLRDVSAVHNDLIYSTSTHLVYIESKYKIPNITGIRVHDDVIIVTTTDTLSVYVRLNGAIYRKASIPKYGTLVHTDKDTIVLVSNGYEYVIGIVRECAVSDGVLVFVDGDDVVVSDYGRGRVPLPFYHWRIEGVDACCGWNGRIGWVRDGHVYVNGERIFMIADEERNEEENEQSNEQSNEKNNQNTTGSATKKEKSMGDVTKNDKNECVHRHRAKNGDQNTERSKKENSTCNSSTIAQYRMSYADDTLFIIKNITDLKKNRTYSKVYTCDGCLVFDVHVFKILDNGLLLTVNGDLCRFGTHEGKRCANREMHGHSGTRHSMNGNAGSAVFAPVCSYRLVHNFRLSKDLFMINGEMYVVGGREGLEVQDFIVQDELFIIKGELHVYKRRNARGCDENEHNEGKHSGCSIDCNSSARANTDASRHSHTSGALAHYERVLSVKLHTKTKILHVFKHSVLLSTYGNLEGLDLPYLIKKALDEQDDINEVLSTLRCKNVEYTNFKNIYGVERTYENFCKIWDGLQMRIDEDECVQDDAIDSTGIARNGANDALPANCGASCLSSNGGAPITPSSFINHFIALNDPVLTTKIFLKCKLPLHALQTIRNTERIDLLHIVRKEYTDDEVFRRGLLLFDIKFIEKLKEELNIKVSVDESNVRFFVYDYLGMYERAFYCIGDEDRGDGLKRRVEVKGCGDEDREDGLKRRVEVKGCGDEDRGDGLKRRVEVKGCGDEDREDGLNRAVKGDQHGLNTEHQHVPSSNGKELEQRTNSLAECIDRISLTSDKLREQYITKYKLYEIAAQHRQFYKLALPFYKGQRAYEIIKRFDAHESIKYAKEHINVLWHEIVRYIDEDDELRMTDNVRAAYYAQVGKTNESIALLLRCERVCEAFKVYADHKRVSKAVHTALMEGCRAYLHGRIDEMVRMKDKVVKLRVKYERMKEVEMDDMSVSTTQSRLKGVEGVRIRYERLVGECEDMIGLVDMVRMVGEWECAGRVANGVDGQREAWGLAEERGAKREGMIRNEINGKKENVSDERTESVSLRWAEMRTAVEMELVLLRSEIEEILQK